MSAGPTSLAGPSSAGRSISASANRLSRSFIPAQLDFGEGESAPRHCSKAHFGMDFDDPVANDSDQSNFEDIRRQGISLLADTDAKHSTTSDECVLKSRRLECSPWGELGIRC